MHTNIEGGSYSFFKIVITKKISVTKNNMLNVFSMWSQIFFFATQVVVIQAYRSSIAFAF